LIDAIRVSQDFVVPKPENAPTSRSNFRITFTIEAVAIMTNTIRLDNYPRREASKVHDIWRNWMLPPEMPTM
jgi:hypothetical protein